MILETSEAPVLAGCLVDPVGKSLQESKTKRVDIWQVGRQAAGETEGSREHLEEGRAWDGARARPEREGPQMGCGERFPNAGATCKQACPLQIKSSEPIGGKNQELRNRPKYKRGFNLK